MKRDIRTSLALKCAAVGLTLVLTVALLLGAFTAYLMASGYGMANEFGEDALIQDVLQQAIYRYEYGNTWYLDNYYQGFSALLYAGDPADGVLMDSYGQIPADPTAQRSYTNRAYDENSRTSTPYTIIGYLDWEKVTPSSNFYAAGQLYRHLHNLTPGSLLVLLCLLFAAVCVLVVYLLCAAGHRRDRDGITPNLQDHIPLDLYLGGVFFLFSLSLILTDFGMAGLRYNGSRWAMLGLLALMGGLLGCSVLVLTALLTLATRMKLGKWWRNSVCYFVLHGFWGLWTRFWCGVREFFDALPLTWRAVALTGGTLLLQSVLVLLFFSFRYEGFAQVIVFLFAVVMDVFLVALAAVVSLQLDRIRDMGAALATGEVDAKLDTRGMLPDVRAHAEHLNAIGVGMNRAVEQRMKSERLKTELITNVSHDIKTPLTSIINYVDLLKKVELPETAAEYLAVLDRQSNRLKKLTEDLVEASKASTGNMTVNMEPIVVNELVHQAIGDYDEKLSAGKLEVVVSSYEGSLQAMADGRLLWRVLDNLLGNVCKYALAGTRVYVDLGVRDGRVFLSLKNISRDQLNVSADELMERFVRGDVSRHTEGSGLGLNIARSLMDLMGGTFSLSVDGDLFKAELTLAPAPAAMPVSPTLSLYPEPPAYPAPPPMP